MNINQKMIAEDFKLPPDPERIVNGLRDTGYNFNTAIADIVDNSISANASLVNIDINIDPGLNVNVYIADNGCGMDLDGLKNAMKYGSSERLEKNSLGKFGLGLKTASTAFCRRFSVISRCKDDPTLRKVQWDLDYVAKQQEWLLQFPEILEDEKELLENTAGNGSGTLVVWDKVDRLLRDYKTKAPAEKGLRKHIDSLKNHLSMVYQRFLNTEDKRASNVIININGEKLSAWDPFCSMEKNTLVLQKEDVPVEMPDNKKVPFHVAAYVLPKRGDFSSVEAEKNAKVSNDLQGVYVYRENRLIHYGDWFGLMKKEPHLSLLRIEFSFDYRLDELLSIDIKKSRILLIGELYEFFSKFFGAPRREAEKRYRDTETKNVHKSGKEAHSPSNSSIEGKASDIVESTIKPVGEDSAEVNNANGTFTKSIRIINSVDPNQARVIAVPDIEGSALWEPSLVNGKHAVNINESHPYYKKIYGPYLAQHIVVEGLDYLLWALAEAENSTCSQSSIENYEDMRHKVSRTLKKLVADLPDPEIPEE
jgi:hypothetical protein